MLPSWLVSEIQSGRQRRQLLPLFAAGCMPVLPSPAVIGVSSDVDVPMSRRAHFDDNLCQPLEKLVIGI